MLHLRGVAPFNRLILEDVASLVRAPEVFDVFAAAFQSEVLATSSDTEVQHDVSGAVGSLQVLLDLRVDSVQRDVTVFAGHSDDLGVR